MKKLTLSETHLISGGYEKNFHDGIEVASIFGIGGAVFGAGIGLITYTNPTIVAQILMAASPGAVTIVSAPIAIFSGIRIGVTIGVGVGTLLYAVGVFYKED
ncbi:MAG: hypothetical protein JSR17_10455 [Proteobacteria bacterium]|nr:hypothetical protein [Pseudomonadota bacterium]